MKTDSKYSKVVCIKDLQIFSNYNFTHNHIYNISSDETLVIIEDDNNNNFEFYKTSPFNKNMRQEYFIELSEIRKQKLQKINERR